MINSAELNSLVHKHSHNGAILSYYWNKFLMWAFWLNIHVVLLDIAKFPLTGTIPFCIPTGIDESLCSTTALSIKCTIKLLSFCLTGEKKHFSRVLICNILILSESEHLFICLKIIIISFYLFMNHLFMSFASLSPVLFRPRIMNLRPTEESACRMQR